MRKLLIVLLLSIPTCAQTIIQTSAQWGMKCDGVTDDTQRFLNAIGTGGGSQNIYIIFPNGTCILKSVNPITVPSYVTLDFTQQGAISLSSGSTLNVNGPVFETDYHPIFTGSGTYNITPKNPVTCTSIVGGIGCTATGTGSGGFSGTVTYTANQTASTSDNGKLVKMNCAAACAYTLPNPQPSTTFYVELTSIGATIATIGLGSSMTVNSSATAPVLTTNQVLSIWADTQTSTNYIQTGPSGMAPGVFNATYEPFFWGLGSSCSSYDNATHTATASACLNGPSSGDTSATNDGFASWVTVNDSSQDSTNADPRVPGYAYRGNCRTGVSNTICEGVFATAAESTTGLSNVKLIGNEIDTLVADAGISGIGVQIIPIGTAQPTANNYPAIQANTNVLHAGASLHTSGLNCPTGAIFIQSANAPCMVLGEQATGNSKNSQTIQFHASDSGGADHQLDVTTAWSAAAAMMNYSANQQATITANSFMAIGVAQTAGNIALSGWGTGSTVTAVSGFAQRFAFTITAGTTPAANPTVTATFSSPMPNAPICVAFPEGGTGTQANLFRATESTSGSGAMVWQGGTPTNGNTYLFVIDCRL